MERERSGSANLWYIQHIGGLDTLAVLMLAIHRAAPRVCLLDFIHYPPVNYIESKISYTI